MAMTLEAAIDYARALLAQPLGQFLVGVTISMHDDGDKVLFGTASGTTPMFRADLPLLGSGSGTTGGGPFKAVLAGPSPGFSTRGLASPNGSASLRDVTLTPEVSFAIDFSVRRFPGVAWLTPLQRLLGLGGPSVQIEIETLSPPAPGGTGTGRVRLEVTEDGALLRAVGPSLLDPTRRASYTATILVVPWIP